MNSFFLVTTPIEQFWDKSKNMVFLGEWCKLYDRRHEWESLNAPVIPYPWNDRQRLYQATRYTEQIYSRLLSTLSGWMNDTHNTDHNLRYWEIIIGHYLSRYIQVMFSHYICIRDACDRFPDLSTAGISVQSYITPSNALEMIFLDRESDVWHLQLFSQISKWVGIDIIQKKLAISEFTLPSVHQKKTVHSPVLQWMIQKITGQLVKRDVVLFLSQFRKRILFQLIFASRLKAWPLSELNNTDPPVEKRNESLRAGLYNLLGQDAFGTFILHSLAANMPFQYLETYKSIKKTVEKYISRPPKAIVTTMGLLHDEVFAVWCAECTERGSKLIGLQHGGSYGENIASPWETNEKRTSDLYVSWGWEEDDQVSPMPASKLMGIIPKGNKPDGKDILWVSTCDSRYTYFLSNTYLGPQFLHYFEFQSRFYESVVGRIRENLLLRLYPIDFGWNLHERWGNRYPEIRFDDSGRSFRESACNSKILVIDHFGSTTFLEAISMNLPVIVFGDRNHFDIRDKAKPYYDMLNSVGMLHYSPEDAARQLNDISDDVNQWWSDKKRQQALKIFASRYAKYSPHAVREWGEFLIHLSKPDFWKKKTLYKRHS